MQHLEDAHPDEVKDTRQAHIVNKQIIFPAVLYAPKVRNIYGLVAYVVYCLRSFAVMENKDVREHLRFNPIAMNIFKDYFKFLTNHVE